MQGNEAEAITNLMSGFVVYSWTEIVLNVSLAFLLGVAISSIYKFTHKGMSYSQSFMITLVFVATIVAIVMMVIGNNLASLCAGRRTVDNPLPVGDQRYKGHVLYIYGACRRHGIGYVELFPRVIRNRLFGGHCAGP